MSLETYDNYKLSRTDFNTSINTLATTLTTTPNDKVAVIISDNNRNVWCIECVGATVENNDIKVSGSCIHFVYLNGGAPEASNFIDAVAVWEPGIGSTNTNAYFFGESGRGTSANLRNLIRYEVYGKSVRSGGGTTISNILKNNTLNPNDDYSIKAVDTNIANRIGSLTAMLALAGMEFIKVSDELGASILTSAAIGLHFSN